MENVDEELHGLIRTLSSSAKFCISGYLAPVLPGLEVVGFGPLGVPIYPKQARLLSQLGSLAPYGKGEETAYNSRVRNVVQLEPKQFSFRNPEWEGFIKSIVATVKTAFSIDQPLAWDLYKMLIYEAGSFFLAHRDTEKQAGMVATLVVCLPSQREGGTLVISHDGVSEEVELDSKEGEFKIQYVAFYTDCKHEFKTLTSGHRVCIVYHLKMAGLSPLSPPLLAEKVNQAVEMLESKFSDKTLDKYAIPLAHGYSEASFSVELLKGKDRSAVALLARAADLLNYRCFIALMTYYQLGDVSEYDYVNTPYESIEMGEIFEESTTLEHWLETDGKSQKFAAITLHENELPSQIDYKAFLLEQEIGGPTGNEGTTMERWYRGAVVVLWPKDRHFQILTGKGQYSALPHFADMVAAASNLSDHQECLSFANTIIESWRAPLHYCWQENFHKSGEMAMLLAELGDVPTAVRFIHQVLKLDYTSRDGEPLATLCSKLGWTPLTEALLSFISQQTPDHDSANLEAIVSIFRDLCAKNGLDPDQKTVCSILAEPMVALMKSWDGQHGKAKNLNRRGILEGLCLSLFHLEKESLASEVIAHALSLPKLYPLHDALIPAVQALADMNCEQVGFWTLLNYCIEALARLTASAIHPPQNWAQKVVGNCSCIDCDKLNQFLKDPAARVCRFKVSKDRRWHLHTQIRLNQMDLNHETERQGNPQTLVCIKNRNAYEREMRQFEQNCQKLAKLSLITKQV